MIKNIFSKAVLFLSTALFLSVCVHASETVSIFHSQDRITLKNEMQKSISEAKRSILIFTFTLSDAATIKLLNNKVNEGVAVTVIIDKEHRLPLSQQGDAKIEVVTRHSGEGRIHHKALIVDEEVVWLGSANITESAFSTQENVMVRLVSRELAERLHKEKEVFQAKRQREAHTPPVFTLSDQEVAFCLLPHDGFPQKKAEVFINKASKERILQAICNANKSIQLAMMVWTESSLAQAVIEAHRRGVNVEVVAQDLGGVIPELQRAGIKVVVNPTFTLMHNKFMYIDHKIFLNGSANWSKSSFSRNDESFVMLYGLTENQVATLDSYWRYLVGK